MAKTGPKARTPKNSPRKQLPTGLWAGFEPPSDFTEAAKTEFSRLQTALSRLGRLEKTDPRLVCVAAELCGLLHQAREEMQGQPLTLKTTNGMMQQHPMIKLRITLARQLREALIALGLSVKETKNAPMKSDDKTSPWDGLLNVAG